MTGLFYFPGTCSPVKKSPTCVPPLVGDSFSADMLTGPVHLTHVHGGRQGKVRGSWVSELIDRSLIPSSGAGCTEVCDSCSAAVSRHDRLCRRLVEAFGLSPPTVQVVSTDERVDVLRPSLDPLPRANQLLCLLSSSRSGGTT